MKSIKLLAATAMLAVCTSASAQFSNANGSSSQTVQSNEGWSTLWLQYNPTNVSVDVKGVDDKSASAISLGYSRAFGVSKSIPLFVEAGAGLQYTWTDEGSEDNLDVNTKLLSIKIPVDLMYKFQIPNSSVAIMPYAGLNLRFNVWGEQKWEYISDDDYSDYYDSDDEKTTFDLFDKKDMGKDEVWNRFQIGWRAGVKARFGKSFMIGAGYGSDFSELYKKAKIGEWTLQLGYTF